jgi:hypothetical protein
VAAGAERVLTQRELNRALLERRFLITRVRLLEAEAARLADYIAN